LQTFNVKTQRLRADREYSIFRLLH